MITFISVYVPNMIIIGRYVRGSKMHQNKQIEKWYTNRNIQLFDPVYWIGRDHCWIEWAKRKFLTPWWYIIRWKYQRYIDSKGYEKQSVIPYWKCRLTISKANYDWYRRVIYKPVKKRYNINIKSKVVQLHPL